MNDRSGESRMEIFPVAMGRYRHHSDIDVDTEVREVGELLSEYGGRLVAWDTPMSARNHAAVSARMDTWANASTGNSFFYWVGHGSATQSHAALAHADSPDLIELDGIAPRALAYRIVAREHRNPDSWSIVVIDSCRSARFVELLNSEVDSLQGPRRLLLVGVSGLGSTTLGEFGRALRGALRDTFAAEHEVGLWRLGEELKARLPEHCAVFPKNTIGLALCRRTPLPTRMTLDLAPVIQEALGRLSDDERRHYLPKAQGGELGELAWYFEGRAAERRAVTAWLHGQADGMLVVTGRAGSGKSALLGNLLVHSRPELRDVLIDASLIEALSDSEQPPDNAFTTAIHLTGLTTSQLLTRIAADLDLRAPDPTSPLTAQLSAVQASLRTRRSPATIMVDGLDEAVDPLTIARAVLRPIAAIAGVRLLVGTRRSTREGPDEPNPTDHDLLDALSPDPDHIVPVARDPEAIRRYIAKRLAVASPAVPRFAIDAAADTLSAAGGEFLFGRLAVHELLANPALLTPAHVGELVDLSRTTHRGLFARAVNRLTAERPVYRTLLTALAHAKGRGLPLYDGIWATIANAVKAVNDGESAPAAANHDISALLTDAAPYLTVDLDLGRTVYRLAHRTFSEHFSTDQHGHQLITSGLIDEAERRLAIDGGPSQPDDPNRYLTRYLSGHAADGGQSAWQRLAEHPHVLDTLDPTAVTSDAMRAAFGRFPLPPAIAGTIGAAHHLVAADPTDRAGLRQLATTRHTAVDRPEPEPRTNSGWTVTWARLTKQPTHLTLTGHHTAVLTVTAFPAMDGRTLLASGGMDRLVRIWDPTTGTAAGPPLVGHTRPIRAATSFALAGRTLLASAGDDATVRIWDPAAGTTVGDPLVGHTGPIRAATSFALAGRTLLASAGDDATVRIWDPATGTMVGTPLIGHVGAVRALTAFSAGDGRILLGSAGDDATVRIWDPATGAMVGTPLAGHTRAVWAVTPIVGPDGRTMVITGSDDRTARIWDVETRAEVRSPTGHADWVWAAASLAGPDGRTLLATGGDGHSIRIWDPLTGTDVGAPLTGHVDWVWAVTGFPGPHGRNLLATCSQDGTVRVWDPAISATWDALAEPARSVTVSSLRCSDGRTLIATGGDDRAVRIWDSHTGTEVSTPPTMQTRHIRAVIAFSDPAGRTLIATGADDRQVHIWDPDSGAEVAPPLTGHTRHIRAVTAFRGPAGRTLIATGGDDRVVRIWDPAAGTEVGGPLTGRSNEIHQILALPDPSGRTLVVTVGAHDGKVWIWEPGRAAARDPRASFYLDGALAAFAGSGGRTLLAKATNRTVQICDAMTNSVIGVPLTGHNEAIRAVVAFTDTHGRVLLSTAGFDGRVRIWEPTTGRCLHRLSLGVPILSLDVINEHHLAVGLRDGFAVLSFHLPAPSTAEDDQ